MGAWKKSKLLVTGVVAMGALMCGLWLTASRGETMADMLLKYGYLEMLPPSHFHGPGTINTIEVTSDNRIKLHPTCDMDAQLLATLTQVSSTVDAMLIQKLNKSYNIAAQLKSLLSAEVGDQQVKDIVIQFKDVKIRLISEDRLLELQEKFINGTCQKIIEWNLSNSGKVCQTQAVLEADVVYTIVYAGHVTASERADITSKVTSQAQFTVAAQEETKAQLLGKGLFFGVQLAPHGIFFNTPEAKAVHCRV